MDFVEIPRLDFYLRPRSAPVALHFDIEILRLDVGDDVGAHLPARGIWPLRGIRGGEVVRDDKVVFIAQNAGLYGCCVCGGFCFAVVILEESVYKLLELCIPRLLRLFIERPDIFRALDLRHRPRVDVSVRAMELDERIVESEAFFERLVGNRRSVERDGIAHGKIVKRGAIGFGVGSGIKERRPVRDLLFLQLVGKGEHLLKLRFKGRRNFLRRPRRHLVLRGFVVELRRSRASPAPAVGVLLVGVREVELQHSLERSGLRVDGRRERGEPFVGTRLAVGELLHRVFADEERARGVRPALGLRRLALDLLDLVRDGARQVLPLRRLDVFPRLFKIVFCHCCPLQRDSGDKRSDNARDSPSDRKFFHVRIIDKIPPLCNGKNEDAKETEALREEACRQGPSSGRSDRVRERAPRCRERPHSGSRRSGASRREAGGT